MVRPVDEDARGIVTPDAGLQRFTLDRFPPSADVGRFVAWYWVVTWDLRGQPSHTQHVFAHPVVNVSFEDEEDGAVNGVSTAMDSRTLTGAGRVLGVMFRPAGFRPFLGRAMTTITDEVLPLSSVVGPAGVEMARAVGVSGDRSPAELAAAADAGFAALLPPDPQPSEATTPLVEQVAADPAFLLVDDLAAAAGLTERQLQRRFADHVGLSPKAVIRRYRLYEAAERARQGQSVDWSTVAAELGYSDQAHLTRDFTASFGIPPARYVQANQP